jgi:hypothetical protein
VDGSPIVSVVALRGRARSPPDIVRCREVAAMTDVLTRNVPEDDLRRLERLRFLGD